MPHSDLCCHLLKPINGHKLTLNINSGRKRETHSPLRPTTAVSATSVWLNKKRSPIDERKGNTAHKNNWIITIVRNKMLPLFTQCARSTHVRANRLICAVMSNQRCLTVIIVMTVRRGFGINVSAAPLKAMKLIKMALIYVLMAWSRQQHLFSVLPIWFKNEEKNRSDEKTF